MPMKIWSYNTIVYRATNFTPFQLMFRAQAVLPKEIKHKSFERQQRSHLAPAKLKAKTCYSQIGSRQ
jgi:hypothetical protein